MNPSPGKTATGVSIIVPAYNECGAIGEMLSLLKKAVPGDLRAVEVIVVDDGSDDRTAEVAGAAGVRVIRHPINSGYGRSLLTGIESAQHDTIAIIDADGTYPVQALPELLAFYDRGFHMVVGARQGKHYQTSKTKQLLRFLFRILGEFTCGRRIPDINSGFRIFDRRPVLAYRPALSTGFSFTTTITLLFMLNHLFVGYLPIEYHERVGKSKVRLVRDSLRSLQIIFTLIAQFNPLKLYLLLIAGTLAGNVLLCWNIRWTPVLFWLPVILSWNAVCIIIGAMILALTVMRPTVPSDRDYQEWQKS